VGYNKVVIDRTVTADAVHRWLQDKKWRDVYDGSEECKYRQAASLLFWLVKTKPAFYLSPNSVTGKIHDANYGEEFIKINEIFGLCIVLNLLVDIDVNEIASDYHDKIVDTLYTTDLSHMSLLLELKKIKDHVAQRQTS